MVVSCKGCRVCTVLRALRLLGVGFWGLHVVFKFKPFGGIVC